MTLELAQQHKNEGNQFFAKKKYDKAIEHYSKAIEYDPTCAVYYSNRSACYQNLNDFHSMISDAKKCIELDPTFLKGYFRLAKGLMELNRFANAYRVLSDGLKVATERRDANVDQEKQSLESELKKCVTELEKEQIKLENSIQSAFINPFSNLNNLASASKRIEMETRRQLLTCWSQSLDP